MRSVMAGPRLCVPRLAASWMNGIALGAAAILWIAGLAAGQQSAATVTETPLATTAPTPATSPGAPESNHAATGAGTEPATAPANIFVPTAERQPTQTSNGADLVANGGQTIDAEGPYQSPLQFSLTGTYLYGSARGFAQVPKGGHNGTSNFQRPQFHSIGINTANIADVELSAAWASYGEFFGGAQFIPLSGAAFTGPKTLTTAGITYPAHARVASDINLSWYRIGYRYPFVLSTARNGVPDMVLTPYVETLIWTFDYNLTVRKARTANRAFNEAGFQVGASFAWRPNGGPLSLEATLGSFPQFANFATISVESLDLRYRFYDWQRFRFSGLLGVTWEQQNFKDHQPLPNHISADFGPLLTAGLQVQF